MSPFGRELHYCSVLNPFDDRASHKKPSLIQFPLYSIQDCRQENEKLKKKNAQLEQTLIQKEAQSTEPKSKKEQDELLLKAKTLLFEKTKVCKQQEQHIAVLKTQVDSVKEVLAVTKEMLNLRNTESDHIQERLKTIETCRQAEKERTALLERKLEISQEAYKKLRQEYDCQSSLNKVFANNA